MVCLERKKKDVFNVKSKFKGISSFKPKQYEPIPFIPLFIYDMKRFLYFLNILTKVIRLNCFKSSGA